MSTDKKIVRTRFRSAVFSRDNLTCRRCGKECDIDELNVHHIIDRNEMPNGGYALENGISLCAECHLKAEMTMNDGAHFNGYTPEDLYNLIGSSKEKAMEASKKLRE